MKQTLPRKRFYLRGFIGVGFQIAQFAVSGTYAYILIDGKIEWHYAQRELATAGYSLDMQTIMKAAVPDAENFGATPALQGIAVSPEGMTPEIKAKVVRINALFSSPPFPEMARDQPMPKETTGNPMDWKAWRRHLAGPMKFDVPPDEPDDAKAVLDALSSRDEALVEELVQAAASRPRAQLLPHQADRLTLLMKHGKFLAGNEDVAGNAPFLFRVFNLLRLRAEAALAARKPDEFERLLPVLFALAELAGNDAALMSFLVTQSMEMVLNGAIQRSINARRLNENQLRHCQEFFGSHSPSDRLRVALQIETASFCHDFRHLIATGGCISTATGKPVSESSTRLEAILFGVVASGNMATAARHFLTDVRLLHDDDWVELLEHRTRLEKSAGSPLSVMRLNSFLADTFHSVASPTFIRRFIYHEMQRRLLITGCALERNRLAGNGFPHTLADLPKALLPEVPLDLDKQPMRYRPTPTGFVIWSVGLNLKDDWHGDRPLVEPKSGEELKPRDLPDWQWRVP